MIYETIMCLAPCADISHERACLCPQNRLLSVALVIALGSLERASSPPLAHHRVELNAGAALTWVVTAYLLAATAALPIYGKLSDMFGRVRMLNIGIGLFLADPWPAPWPRICQPCWPPACCRVGGGG